MHPSGVIETDDDARIQFDARGYGVRGADKSWPHLWRLTAALHFATTDPRYLWLNITLRLWEGAFDEQAGHAGYRAYSTLESAAGSGESESAAAS